MRVREDGSAMRVCACGLHRGPDDERHTRDSGCNQHPCATQVRPLGRVPSSSHQAPQRKPRHGACKVRQYIEKRGRAPLIRLEKLDQHAERNRPDHGREVRQPACSLSQQCEQQNSHYRKDEAVRGIETGGEPCRVNRHLDHEKESKQPGYCEGDERAAHGQHVPGGQRRVWLRSFGQISRGDKWICRGG